LHGDIWRKPFLYPFAFDNDFLDLRSGMTMATEKHFGFFGPVINRDLFAPFGCSPIYIDQFELGEFFELLENETAMKCLINTELENWISKQSDTYRLGEPASTEVLYIDGDAESPDVPDDRMEMMFNAGDGAANLNRPESSLLGRESDRNIVECTYKAFPSGKGNAKWHEVVLRVGYSRRAICRSLQRLGKYREWARGGQDVQ
jgi:hypothetical protein